MYLVFLINFNLFHQVYFKFIYHFWILGLQFRLFHIQKDLTDICILNRSRHKIQNIIYRFFTGSQSIEMVKQATVR